MDQPPKIYRLSDLSPERLAEIQDSVINNPKIKKPYKEFDAYGLKFDIDWLNEVGGSVVFLPLEHAAEYADIVTVNGLKEPHPEFLQQYKNDIEKRQDFSLWNATAVGNVAYVSLFCKDDELKINAFNLLQQYADYFYFDLISKFNNGMVN